MQDLLGQLQSQWKRFPRKSGPGPLGDRQGHYAFLAEDVAASNSVAQVAGMIVERRLPGAIMVLVAACRLFGTPKKWPGLKHPSLRRSLATTYQVLCSKSVEI